jgi:four helix bundle protein
VDGEWNKMGKIISYEDIEVWQKAHKLVIWVYKTTESLPKSESFGLTSQLRRSASSVPTNLVEGFHRGSTKELIQFLITARGSLGETLYHLHLSKDLGYISDKDFSAQKKHIDITGKQLNAWIRSLKLKLTNH